MPRELLDLIERISHKTEQTLNFFWYSWSSGLSTRDSLLTHQGSLDQGSEFIFGHQVNNLIKIIMSLSFLVKQSQGHPSKKTSFLEQYIGLIYVTKDDRLRLSF